MILSKSSGQSTEGDRMIYWAVTMWVVSFAVGYFLGLDRGRKKAHVDIVSKQLHQYPPSHPREEIIKRLERIKKQKRR